MFPFRTKRFSVELEIDKNEFSDRIGRYSLNHRFVHRIKGQDRATISGAQMDWALSSVPTRNSFRPVAVLRWKIKKGKTFLSGYYRLSKGLLFVSFMFLLLGLVISIRKESPYPILLFIALWVVFFQLLGFLFFAKSLTGLSKMLNA
jgi:hypothetical protein